MLKFLEQFCSLLFKCSGDAERLKFDGWFKLVCCLVFFSRSLTWLKLLFFLHYVAKMFMQEKTFRDAGKK